MQLLQAETEIGKMKQKMADDLTTRKHNKINRGSQCDLIDEKYMPEMQLKYSRWEEYKE